MQCRESLGLCHVDRHEIANILYWKVKQKKDERKEAVMQLLL